MADSLHHHALRAAPPQVYLNEYETFEDALRNIRHYIEKAYSKKRLHSALGHKVPDQFEIEAALDTVALTTVYYQ